jgi:hypothetical protein
LKYSRRVLNRQLIANSISCWFAIYIQVAASVLPVIIVPTGAPCLWHGFSTNLVKAAHMKKQSEENARERDTAPSAQTGDQISTRNNNVDFGAPSAAAADTESADNEGLGDSAIDDARLTNYTQNHSNDA